jgi:hypothetical protein
VSSVAGSSGLGGTDTPHGRAEGCGIHAVTISSLGRTTVSAPVMGNDAITVLQEKQHLGAPIIAGQWPAVTEDDRLTRAPVLEEDQ